jgi:DNA primase
LKTGICYQNDRGELIDRYAGRVIFPWIGISGKVVGFGGRKLDAATKGVQQKYVNSPDSDIYHKDHELYGIYQAKKTIAKEDRVYMVEGYTDVISMHQCGIENVVANSGTALSVHQIHTLHRFTSNITLLYDGDAAGIHAALRGTDMLLAEGMNLKVLLLPEGEDPDSFARKHTAIDFRKYIEENQTDFIQFKTDLLLKNQRDPLKRSEAINSIVQSIAVVQNQILRDTYLHDCAQRIGINEGTLINQMNRYIREKKEGRSSDTGVRREEIVSTPKINLQNSSVSSGGVSTIEKMLIQMIIRYGEMVVFRNIEDEEGNVYNLTVAQFIHYNMATDGLQFSSELYNRILSEAVEHCTDADFKAENYFIHHEDINISQIATMMSEDLIQLAESQQMRVDEESIRNRTLHLILDFRMDYLDERLKMLQAQIASSADNAELTMKLMAEYKDASQLRNAIAKQLGSNILL